MFDFWNTKEDLAKKEANDFPLKVKNVTNPNWLSGPGQPSHWEVCDHGGTITVTPKYGGK